MNHNLSPPNTVFKQGELVGAITTFITQDAHDQIDLVAKRVDGIRMRSSCLDKVAESVDLFYEYMASKNNLGILDKDQSTKEILNSLGTMTDIADVIMNHATEKIIAIARATLPQDNQLEFAIDALSQPSSSYEDIALDAFDLFLKAHSYNSGTIIH